MRKRILVAVMGALALAATLLSATPAQATVEAVSNCNSQTANGVEIYRITHNGVTRIIYAKACIIYDLQGSPAPYARTAPKLTCRTGSGGPCDFRGEIYHGKLDVYWPNDTGFYKTAMDDHFISPVSGSYNDQYSWSGTRVLRGATWPSPWPCNWWIQNNNGTVFVRFGFDGVLRSVPNFFSTRHNVC